MSDMSERMFLESKGVCQIQNMELGRKKIAQKAHELLALSILP